MSTRQQYKAAFLCVSSRERPLGVVVPAKGHMHKKSGFIVDESDGPPVHTQRFLAQQIAPLLQVVPSYIYISFRYRKGCSREVFGPRSGLVVANVHAATIATRAAASALNSSRPSELAYFSPPLCPPSSRSADIPPTDCCIFAV